MVGTSREGDRWSTGLGTQETHPPLLMQQLVQLLITHVYIVFFVSWRSLVTIEPIPPPVGLELGPSTPGPAREASSDAGLKRIAYGLKDLSASETPVRFVSTRHVESMNQTMLLCPDLVDAELRGSTTVTAEADDFAADNLPYVVARHGSRGSGHPSPASGADRFVARMAELRVLHALRIVRQVRVDVLYIERLLRIMSISRSP